MSKLEIETAQNVYIEYEVASLGTRYLACLIDYMLAISYMLAVSFIFLEINPNRGFSDTLWTVFIMLPLALYHLLSEVFFEGQSLGKNMMRIKVVKLDGTPVRFTDYALRWVFRFPEIFMTMGGVAILVILGNGKGQRIGDLAAGTSVVSLERRVYLRELLVKEFKEDYEPLFPQVAKLKDKDIALIKSVYTDAKKIRSGDVLSELSAHVAKVLEVKPKMGSVKFLEQVIRDYNYLNQA